MRNGEHMGCVQATHNQTHSCQEVSAVIEEHTQYVALANEPMLPESLSDQLQLIPSKEPAQQQLATPTIYLHHLAQ
jgi:hypothetical protein